jgi:hypothetical protein
VAWDLYDLATSPEQPEPRSGEGRREARAAGATDAAQRAVTFLQHCIIYTTSEPRSANAAQRRTTYASTRVARLRQYVTLTYGAKFAGVNCGKIKATPATICHIDLMLASCIELLGSSN